MIDFSRSTFTWKTFPFAADPHYRWPGGFVGTPGQVYHVRFHLDARCLVRCEASGATEEIFLGAPCRSEYTIARRNLFQVPSDEWRLAFDATHSLPVARRPSDQVEAVAAAPLAQRFAEWRLDLRQYEEEDRLRETAAIVQATLAGDRLHGLTTYRDGRGFEVTLEYPVNVMNLNAADGQFQVCTGPVLLPDLATWDGERVHRAFLAHAAFAALDHAEFILRREVEADASERQWLDRPVGRDRLELRDPAQAPAGYPPPRPRPKAYNEVWELAADNAVLRTRGSASRPRRA